MHKKGLLGFEHKRRPVLSRTEFAKRLARSAGIALIFTALSLFVGMCGYHFLEDLPWLDSFLNASMILSGMGPVDHMKSDGGKLFAGFYALYSGLFVIAAAGVLFAPVVHRMLHRFHAEADEEKKD